jgi:DNA-binding SARP family transcriptional activator
LRRALGNPDWIIRSHNLYSFNRQHACGYEYDVDVFTAKVAEAQRLRVMQPQHAIALFEGAVAVYAGEYADSLATAEWIAQRQDALRHTYHDALLGLASLQLLHSDTHRALATFQLLTGQNKYAEEAHRGVIQCYVRLHDYSQATEYYNQLRAMFEDELGVSPAPETRAALQPTVVSISAIT